MKKKIILITFVLITLFIIFNYKVFLGNYYFLQANDKYIANNFSGALDGYNNSSNYMSGSKIDFNKGNTYYKMGEKEENIDLKITNYTESLNLYSKILESDLNNEKQENPDVRYNYEFVKKKLEELQEQNKEDEEKDKTEQDQKEQEQGDESGEEQNSDTGQEQNSGEQEDKMPQFELSPQELEQINQYVENLKQEEKYNRDYFNNVKPVQNNPFFDSVFDRGGEKDW